EAELLQALGAEADEELGLAGRGRDLDVLRTVDLPDRGGDGPGARVERVEVVSEELHDDVGRGAGEDLLHALGDERAQREGGAGAEDERPGHDGAGPRLEGREEPAVPALEAPDEGRLGDALRVPDEEDRAERRRERERDEERGEDREDVGEPEGGEELPL